MKSKLTLSTALAALLLCSSSYGAVVLTPSDSRVVSAAGTQTAQNINTTGHPSEPYVIRTRNNAGDTDQTIATFIQFDVSSLTVSDVNSSGFQALFNIDHVATLGGSSNLNTFFVARNTTDDWAWDSSGDNNPLYSWIDDAVALGILGDTFSGNSTIPTTLSLDITSTVQGWVNGTSDNLGLSIYGATNTSGSGQNAFGFEDAQISIVPEPSSLALISLAGLALLRRRRA